MRPENTRMKEFLNNHGIKGVRPKYIFKGSLRGYWSLYIPEKKWTEADAKTLNDLGFTDDFDGTPFSKYSGNGGIWSVLARGHNELLKKESLNHES